MMNLVCWSAVIICDCAHRRI